MKLHAVVTVDIQAADFLDAAEQQRTMEALLVQVQDVYPDATLVFRERRLSARHARATTSTATIVSTPARPTGRLSRYVD